MSPAIVFSAFHFAATLVGIVAGLELPWYLAGLPGWVLAIAGGVVMFIRSPAYDHHWTREREEWHIAYSRAVIFGLLFGAASGATGAVIGGESGATFAFGLSLGWGASNVAAPDDSPLIHGLVVYAIVTAAAIYARCNGWA